jgi:hypothetical protein
VSGGLCPAGGASPAPGRRQRRTCSARPPRTSGRHVRSARARRRPGSSSRSGRRRSNSSQSSVHLVEQLGRQLAEAEVPPWAPPRPGSARRTGTPPASRRGRAYSRASRSTGSPRCRRVRVTERRSEAGTVGQRCTQPTTSGEKADASSRVGGMSMAWAYWCGPRRGQRCQQPRHVRLADPPRNVSLPPAERGGPRQVQPHE